VRYQPLRVFDEIPQHSKRLRSQADPGAVLPQAFVPGVELKAAKLLHCISGWVSVGLVFKARPGEEPAGRLPLPWSYPHSAYLVSAPASRWIVHTAASAVPLSPPKVRKKRKEPSQVTATDGAALSNCQNCSIVEEGTPARRRHVCL
jgi:hypothetical protein